MSPPTPADVPLTFHNPPGWPEPTAEWIALHQGWEPDASWVPDPSAPLRPDGWVLWSRNAEVWDHVTAPARSALRTQLLVATIIGAVGVIASVVLAATGWTFGGWHAVLALAVLYPLTLAVLHPARRRRIDEAAHARVVEAAAEQRRLADTFTAVPASASAASIAEASSSARPAAAADWDALVTGGAHAQEGRHVGSPPVGRRTGVVIGVAGSALVAAALAIVVFGALAGRGGAVGFEVRDASQAEGEAASEAFSPAGGWVWMVTLDRQCEEGAPEATVEFSSTESGDTEQQRTFALNDVADTEQTLAVDGQDLPPYAVLTRVGCVV